MELLPVEYCGQKSAWMSSEIFHAWFHNSFISTVCKELSSLGLEPKAVLVLDNCPAHPNEEDLNSDDGNITALYLPPSVTPSSNQWIKGSLRHSSAGTRRNCYEGY